ncbi:MAG: ComEC/Rec2 family competence protein [Chloroflexota bacterium]|nr:ComEC/Rec2 family competence protein [Chloroflexota bacterium]
MRVIFAVLGWISGIVYAATLPPSADFVPFALVAAIGTLLAAILLKRASLVFFTLAAFAFVRFQALPAADNLAPFRDETFITLDGTIDAEPDRRDTAVHVRVRVSQLWHQDRRHTLHGVVLVHAPTGFSGQLGDTIRASGILSTPPELDRFSYADMLARADIYSLMRRGRVQLLAHATLETPFTSLIALRNDSEVRIGIALPEPYAGLLTGILLGDERGIAPEMRDAFAQTGASHVIAISGFNMAVLGGMIGGLLRRLRIPPLPAAVISIGLIAVYTLFVGASPSVVRAAFMTGVVFLGTALRRDVYVPTSLAFTVLVLSIFDPLILWDVGFQLSAFAVLGIALFADPLIGLHERIFADVPRRLQPISLLLRDSFTIGLAALAFTLPLSALYFGTISPAMLLVNILIVPVQPLIMLFGGLALFATAVHTTVGLMFFWAALLPLGWTVGIVRLFAAVPTLEVYPPPGWIAVAFIALISAAVVRARHPEWLASMTKLLASKALYVGLFAAALTIFLLALLIGSSRPDGRLHLWFYDLSNSAVVIVTPGGKQIVIDGGAYPSRLLTAVGDRLPFYDRTIELGIITTSDAALISAVPALYERYHAESMLINGSLNGSPVLDAVNTAVARFPRLPVESGTMFDLGDGVTLTVLHTPSSASDSTAALMLRLDYGAFSALLTGNVGVEDQARAIAAGTLAPVTLLQVPNGGEKNGLADGFAARVMPQWVIVQGDELYQRHRPDPAVIAQFGGARLLRTDLHGVIHIDTDGVYINTATARRASG